MELRHADTSHLALSTIVAGSGVDEDVVGLRRFDEVAWPAHRREETRSSPALSTSARLDLATNTAAADAATGADYQRRQRPAGPGLATKATAAATVVIIAVMQRTRQRSASQMG